MKITTTTTSATKIARARSTLVHMCVCVLYIRDEHIANAKEVLSAEHLVIASLKSNHHHAGSALVSDSRDRIKNSNSSSNCKIVG